MECLGIGNKPCGKWVYDPQFPNDNLCAKCAEKIEKERKALIRHIKEQGSTSLTSEELSEELENALFVARIRPALLEITEKN